MKFKSVILEGQLYLENWCAAKVDCCKRLHYKNKRKSAKEKVLKIEENKYVSFDFVDIIFL